MATGWQVLEMLIPNGGWSILGDDYEGIQFNEAKPITKAEFEAGFAQYDAWKIAQETKESETKTALLTKLGLTANEAKLLLS